jgi:hypothetical protein
VYIELNLVFELGQNFLNLKKCARIEITRFKNGEKLAQTCSQRTSKKKKKKKTKGSKVLLKRMNGTTLVS